LVRIYLAIGYGIAAFGAQIWLIDMGKSWVLWLLHFPVSQRELLPCHRTAAATGKV